MKKLLLFTLLCFSINGFAFNWKYISENTNGSSYYIDVDNIKKHNGLVYYWELGELLEPRSSGTISFINRYKVDCIEGKRTWLSASGYRLPRGKGTQTVEVNPNQTQYPKPNAVGYSVMKFACDYAKYYLK
tara:strand:+ start:484 stop:876 length:393 start_codon:yes stop_codon:yes gene_type:complete